MTKLYLCEACSGVIAIVLLVADCRHLAMDVPAEPTAFSGQPSSDLRHFLTIQQRNGDELAGAGASAGTDVIQQLNGLSALISAGKGHQTYVATASPEYFSRVAANIQPR
jgi:hypothetical protein